MQNLENMDVFEILITQKQNKMPEGPFCQIGAHNHYRIRSLFTNHLTPSRPLCTRVKCKKLMSDLDPIIYN